MRAVFRGGLGLMVWLYQRSGGKIGGQVQGLPVLLLTTTGRRTGQPRVNPLGYFEHAGAYVVAATNAGFAKHPAWYHNLTSNPHVAVQIGDRRFSATATPADPALRRQLWAELEQRAPGYAPYERRTKREIPVILLRPEAPA